MGVIGDSPDEMIEKQEDQEKLGRNSYQTNNGNGHVNGQIGRKNQDINPDIGENGLLLGEHRVRHSFPGTVRRSSLCSSTLKKTDLSRRDCSTEEDQIEVSEMIFKKNFKILFHSETFYKKNLLKKLKIQNLDQKILI
jgi:hypothetical protein